MLDGDIFPVIHVATLKGKTYLVDGRHRLSAYEENGEEYVNCEVQTNLNSIEDIYLASIRANLKHGLQYSDKDKEKIAYTLKDMKYDVDYISKMLHISTEEIHRLRVNKMQKVIFKSKDKDIKTILSEKNKPKPDIKILDATQEQIIEIENFKRYIFDEKIKIRNKQILMMLKDIKNKINKIIRERNK